MSEPKLGMNYSDCAKRIKRIQNNSGHPLAKRNIIDSLKNQCRLAEGNSAIKELERECAFPKRSSSFTGAGNKQVGWGEGKRLGDGRWRYDSDTWVQVS